MIVLSLTNNNEASASICDTQKKIIYAFTPKANFSFNIADDLILNQKFVPAEQVTINYLSGESQWKRV